MSDTLSMEEATGTRAVEETVEIAATPEQVWRALTEAAELERWFPLEARVVPGEGGEIHLSWKNEFAGTSRIVAWEPPRRLAARYGFGEEAGGAVEVTEYRLEARGGGTVLRVVTSGIPEGAAWDDWYHGTRRGWRYELRSLKHYLERHAGQPRQVVYLRRRVQLSPEEIWRRLTGPDGWHPLPGRPIHEEPGWQWAAVVDRPPDALVRISVEPTMEPPARDATLWLAAWGDHGDELARIRGEWLPRLERLFPEGRTV
jgi:uncharacterized protein YndB with AHSA1/START domain